MARTTSIEQKNVWVKKRSVTSALKDSKGGQLWWVCPLPLPQTTTARQVTRAPSSRLQAPTQSGRFFPEQQCQPDVQPAALMQESPQLCPQLPSLAGGNSRYWDLPSGPVLRSHLPTQGTWVQTLVKELRPHMPRGTAKPMTQRESPRFSSRARESPSTPRKTQYSQKH